MTVMVSLDMEKAFNKIDMKLKEASFPSRFFKTIRAYLRDRRFYKVNWMAPSERSLLLGVPQGSALGPVLFTIYIIDIPKSDDQRVLNAADDTAILATSRNTELALKLAQVHLTKISNFSDVHGPTINPRKTQAIAFAWKQHGPFPKIKIRAMEMNWSSKIEYSGMILDKRLNFAEHLRARYRALGAVRHPILSNNCLKPKTGVMLYKSHIHPTLTYASTIWVTTAPTLHYLPCECIKSLLAISTTRIPTHFAAYIDTLERD
ncbi:hypothetical protein AMK59_405 [Oryctes borbonicus]|uniref:Reverse transcriptase domain-containing protein n=1 Tax=Oryctes borbonicus TaxID=1629725 RepID=A0A0T6BGB1_9SCAR|nr:hypothetical protein AMK59_405 [Oryctes borbonicus]